MNLIKAGGLSAIVAGLTYIVGFAIMLAVLLPAGWSGAADGDKLALMAQFRPVLWGWNLIIYVLNAFVLIVLVLAIYRLQQHHAPGRSAVAAAIGLIWAGLVLASGMLANIAMDVVLAYPAADQEAALALWQATDTVREALGGGNEVTGAIWVLLVSWSAYGLSRFLNILGIVIGVAGVLTILPALTEDAASVFGLGFIVWFIWAGITLLRRPG